MHYIPAALLTLPALPGGGGEGWGVSVEVQAGGRAWPLILFFFCPVKSPLSVIVGLHKVGDESRES